MIKTIVEFIFDISPVSKQTATATDPPLANFSTMHSRVVKKNPKKIMQTKVLHTSKNNPVFLNLNISNTPFNQRSIVHQKALFLRYTYNKSD